MDIAENDYEKMPPDTKPLEAVKEWRGQLGYTFVEGMATIAVYSPAAFASIKTNLVEALARSATLAATMTHKEQVAYAYGVGTAHVLLVVRTDKPIKVLGAIAAAVDVTELSKALTEVLNAVSVSALVFLVSADQALGTPNALLEEIEFAEAEAKAAQAKVGQQEGVH